MQREYHADSLLPGLNKAVTVVITACGRPDLLEQMLDSFLTYNSYQYIAEILVVEDSGLSEINAALVLKYGSQVTWLENPVRLGQIAAIDRAYAQVKTPYIFHCEEDWVFFRSGFIEASMTILEICQEILMVWLRAHDDTNGHPFEQDISRWVSMLSGPELRYRRMHHGFRDCWHGFSFNPGLRRLRDYTAHFPQGFSQQIHFERNNPGKAEAAISRTYQLLGFYAAILEEPDGFVRHIGWDRHVE